MSEPMSDEDLAALKEALELHGPAGFDYRRIEALLDEVERLRSLVAARGAALERIRDDYGDVWGGSRDLTRGGKRIMVCMCCDEEAATYDAIVHDVDCPVSIAARSLVVSLGGGGEGLVPNPASTPKPPQTAETADARLAECESWLHEAVRHLRAVGPRGMEKYFCDIDLECEHSSCRAAHFLQSYETDCPPAPKPAPAPTEEET